MSEASVGFGHLSSRLGLFDGVIIALVGIFPFDIRRKDTLRPSTTYRVRSGSRLHSCLPRAGKMILGCTPGASYRVITLRPRTRSPRCFLIADEDAAAFRLMRAAEYLLERCSPFAITPFTARAHSNVQTHIAPVNAISVTLFSLQFIHGTKYGCLKMPCHKSLLAMQCCLAQCAFRWFGKDESRFTSVAPSLPQHGFSDAAP